MDKKKYTDAVAAIITHDAIIDRIRSISGSLAREVCDDFGGLAIIPETPLRRAYIGLVESAARDSHAVTTYLIDEALGMKDGGTIESKSGECFAIRNAEDAWAAIQAFCQQAD